ncbi:MAG: glucose-6-phosphate isomerase, partial [Gemmataceae bacterium]
RLAQVRDQIAAERSGTKSGSGLPSVQSGFIDLPHEMLEDFRQKREQSDLARCLECGDYLRQNFDVLVVLGKSSPYFGTQALFQALRNRHHNELPPEKRLGIPRVYFAGHSFDPDSFQELIDLLQDRCVDPNVREERWAVLVLSNREHDLESGIALRCLRKEGEEYYGSRSGWLEHVFSGVTDRHSKLRHQLKGMGASDDSLLTVPDSVGSRFCIFSPVCLLPASALGMDIRALLLGAAMMTKKFLEEPVETNPVLQLAGLNHLLHKELSHSGQVLAVWSDKLEGVGHWYEQMFSDSLGQTGLGLLPQCRVMPRDHSAFESIQPQGPRSRPILNLHVKTVQSHSIRVQMADPNHDELNQFNRKNMHDFSLAAMKSINKTMWEAGRPTIDLYLPNLSEHSLGQLLQLFMLSTVVQAQLLGVNPYGHSGAEAYLKFIPEFLRG